MRNLHGGLSLQNNMALSLGKGGEVKASLFRRKQNDLFITQTLIISVPVLDVQKRDCFVLYALSSNRQKDTERNKQMCRHLVFLTGKCQTWEVASKGDRTVQASHPISQTSSPIMH